MALYLETFTCARCGRPARRVDRDDSASPTMCSTCSDELTAAAAVAHDTLLWVHRAQEK